MDGEGNSVNNIILHHQLHSHREDISGETGVGGGGLKLPNPPVLCPCIWVSPSLMGNYIESQPLSLGGFD